jgi:hypothetical protein
VVAVQRPRADAGACLIGGHRPQARGQHAAVVLAALAGVVDVAEVDHVHLAAAGDRLAHLLGHVCGHGPGARQPAPPVPHEHDARIVALDFDVGRDAVEPVVALGQPLEHRLADLGHPAHVGGRELVGLAHRCDRSGRSAHGHDVAQRQLLDRVGMLCAHPLLDRRLQHRGDRIAAHERHVGLVGTAARRRRPGAADRQRGEQRCGRVRLGHPWERVDGVGRRGVQLPVGDRVAQRVHLPLDELGIQRLLEHGGAIVHRSAEQSKCPKRDN